MNCEDTQAQLSAYLDGGLDEARRRMVEEHLAGCSHCLAELAALRRTIASVSGLGSVEPPPGFSQRVMAQVRDEARRPGRRRSFLFPLWAKIPLQAAAALLIAGLAVYLYELNQPPPPVQTPTEAPAPMRHDEGARTDQERPAKLSEAQSQAPATAPPAGAISKDRAGGAALTQKAQRSPATEQPTPTPSKETGRFSGQMNEPPAPQPGAAAAGKKSENTMGAIGGAMAEQKTAADAVIAAKRTADRALTLTPDPAHRDQALLTQTITELAHRVGGAAGPAEQDTPPAIDTLAGAKLDRPSSETAAAPNVIWLTVPAGRYEQFTRELAALGSIQLEAPAAAPPAPPIAGVESFMTKAAPSEPQQPAPAPLRIKLTILLPE